MFTQRFISLIRRLAGVLPPKSRLRVLTWIDCFVGWAEPENVFIPPLVPQDRRRVAVDVGANNGVTTCIMAGLFGHVHAFEANPRLVGELIAGAPANVQVHGMAVSSQAGEALLNVPVSDGVTLEGWASMEAPLLAKFEHLNHIRVETQTLDSFDFSEVGLLKIDVEGHELAVLAGAASTIRRCLPWLIIEALGAQQGRVRDVVLPLGYRETTLHELTGRQGSAHNLVFLPPSQL